jgi:hypothetical protein
MEKSLERAGNMMLELAQQYYQEPRTMIITGAGSKPKVERFDDADIIQGVTVKVEAGSGLPRTRAGKQARVMQMLQMGILSPTKAYKYLDMADFKGVQMQFEADEEQAMREHDKLLDGQVVNEQAAKQAQDAVMMQMLQDPQAPIDPQALQQSVEAGLQPLPFENKSVHLETHGAYMKSAEFESLPFEVKQQFYKHYELTQQALQAEAAPQGDAPKVSLQLRGAVGPTVGSKMLTQSGVKDVTPQELLEPPLDTVVIDNKDKANAGEGAGGAQDQYQMELLQKLQGNQALADQKIANTMAEQAVTNG